ncbi:hypothetical protein ABTB81_19610, partial [Acinetobacter baumannii]
LQIIESARKATGHPIPAEIVARRDGDPSTLIASNSKSRKLLGWQPRFEQIDKIISDAWTWHQAHPNGYQSSLTNRSETVAARK